MKYIKKVGDYILFGFLIGFAEAMTLLATGAMWLADRAKRAARKMENDE